MGGYVVSGGGGGGWTKESDVKVTTMPLYQTAIESITNKPYVQNDDENVFGWIKSNWQLAALGLVALIVLIKD